MNELRIPKDVTKGLAPTLVLVGIPLVIVAIGMLRCRRRNMYSVKREDASFKYKGPLDGRTRSIMFREQTSKTSLAGARDVNQ